LTSAAKEEFEQKIRKFNFEGFPVVAFLIKEKKNLVELLRSFKLPSACTRGKKRIEELLFVR
jgi:hypothetical protein